MPDLSIREWLDAIIGGACLAVFIVGACYLPLFFT